MANIKQFTKGTAEADAVVDAIRADALVGDGSCSHVDECYSAGDLIDRINEHNAEPYGAKQVRSPGGAVRHFRRSHRLVTGYADDIRASAW